MPDKRPVIQTGLLKRFLTRNRSYWTPFVLIFAINSLSALSASLIPFIAGQLFIQILPGGNQQLLQALPLVLAALLLIIAVANWSGYYVIHRMLDRLILDVRVEMFKRLLILAPVYSEFPASTISSYFFKSVKKLQRNFITLVICLSRDLLVVIGLFSVMTWLDPDVSLLILTILIATFFIWQISYAVTHQKSMLTQRHREVSGMLFKALSHRRMIRLDKGYKQEIEHFQDMFKQLQLALLQRFYQIGLLELLVAVFLISASAGLFYYFLQRLTSGQLTVENTVVFFTAGFMLTFPLKRLFRVNSLLKQCNEALHSIFSLLDKGSVVMNAENTDVAQAGRVHGRLRFEKVSYRDSHKNFWLSCFNFEIPPGKKIALVNQNPYINKLFVDLVCGFTQPLTGRIFLDDKDINQIAHAELYGNIVWISPDEVLSGDTVAANIAYGSLRCSKEIAITTAAHTSQAMEFIRKLPHGLQTELKQCVATLSDDQRQRILIARALLKNPSIIILDESTACFDTDNTFLMHALYALLNDHTVLILSSRPVMLDLADQVVDPESINTLSAAS